MRGAALDLAWMQRIGVGGVHVFSGALFEPTVVHPAVPFLSQTWQRTFRESIATAKRAGMEVTIAGSPGWSETGGTWVAPEDAMKKYVWSETRIQGGQRFTGELVQPPSVTGPYQGVKRKRSNHVAVELTHDVYRDSVVIAIPAGNVSPPTATPRFTSATTGFEDSLVTELGRGQPASLLTNSESYPVSIQADYLAPTMVYAVSVGLGAPAEVEVLVDRGDGTWQSALTVPADPEEKAAVENTYSLATPMAAKSVRVLFRTVVPKTLPGMQGRAAPPKPKSVLLSHLVLHTEPRVNQFEAKAGFSPAIDFSTSRTPPFTSRQDAVRSASVVDVTPFLQADGSLNWTPPPGTWTVLRIGYSLTGQTNAPAEVEATGLEVDKLDAGLVRKYLEHYLDLYHGRIRSRLRHPWHTECAHR